MTNSKLTYVAALTKAIEVLTADANLDADLMPVVERLTDLKAQTEKRNTADRKPTKAQVQNAELADVVAEVLRNASEPLTVSEIMARDERLSALSNQKVSAVIRTMGAQVIRVTEKRVSKFQLA